MKAKEIKDYLVSNYGECRHDAKKVEKALINTSKAFELDKKDLFHFIFECESLAGTHYYGFHTACGREIHRVFEEEYYGA